MSRSLRIVSSAVVILWAGVSVVAVQTPKVWKVEVLLNGQPFLTGHSHVAPDDPSGGLDQTCVGHSEVAALTGGTKYVVRKGTDLDAVAIGNAAGAVLRVQQLGRISSKVHQVGNQEFIPLSDLARALGAKLVRDKPGRVNLIVDKANTNAILAPTKKALRGESPKA